MDTRTPKGPDEMIMWRNTHQPSVVGPSEVDRFYMVFSFLYDAVRDALARDNTEFNTAIRLYVVSSFMMEIRAREMLEMPVFGIELSDGTTLRLAYDFHDWVVSVSAEQDVETDFMGLFDTNRPVRAASWEGGRQACLYGPYATDKRQFSARIDSHHRLFTFFWILAHGKKTRRTP